LDGLGYSMRITYEELVPLRSMVTQTLAPPFVERRKPRQKNPPKEYGWAWYLVVITALMGAGFVVSRGQLYSPGDKVGYYLGLVGGVMMLTLLLYPLRKRARFMKNWGILPKWFQWHMVFGVLGPALIVLHTNFHVASINAGMALFFTLVVSGSGIFARFFYTKIHWGLYGRMASYEQLQQDMDGYGDVKSILGFAPEVQRRLLEFRDYAMSTSQAGTLNPWQLMTLSVRAELLAGALQSELEEAMYKDAPRKHWNAVQMRLLDKLCEENKNFVRSYLMTVRDIAQFRSYERLFSIWNFFHVPPVFILAFSATWHVIGVNMY
jgi:hypothetical protein